MFLVKEFGILRSEKYIYITYKLLICLQKGCRNPVHLNMHVHAMYYFYKSFLFLTIDFILFRFTAVQFLKLLSIYIVMNCCYIHVYSISQFTLVVSTHSTDIAF